MDANPTVGIITRTKDRLVLLRRAIESVISQTYGNWALVIVNDGGPAAELEALVDRYREPAGGRIRVVHNARSLGMEGASKVGFDAIGGELLIVHDDDDSWAPEFLSVAVSELLRIQKKYPKTQGVVTYSHRVLESVVGNSIHIESVEPFNGWAPPGFVSLDRMLAGNFIPPISFLFARDAYEAIGIYESIPYLGDWEFFIRFLASNDVFLVPQYLAFYHWRTASTPGGVSNTVLAEVDQHRFYKQLLLNKWLREDFAAGKQGIGVYANLRIHLETMASRQPASASDLADVRYEMRWWFEDLVRRQSQSAAGGGRGHSAAGIAGPDGLAQEIVDYYWQSPSWRAMRWIRMALNRALGLPAEKAPVVDTVEEAWEAARRIQESLSWSLTAPLRWGRIAGRAIHWAGEAKANRREPRK